MLETQEATFTFRNTLKWTLLGVLFLLLVSYAVFQARFLIIGPQIALSSEPKLLQNERRIFLEGTAYNISRLWLNDRQIFTDAQGTFREALILENGYTISTLRAEDRYGRSTTLTRDYVYTPASFIE
jgi:hypothetical protein